jgi:Rps23 Pro-64 3,4-dihydroxylase Tpa1-like proline 4-hydroxylase
MQVDRRANVNGINLSELLSRETLSAADTIRERFQGADPFPHVVIDDFLKADFAEILWDDFPKKDEKYSKFCMGEDGKLSENYSNHDVNEFPSAFQRLDQLMKAPSFLSLLSELTGIPALEYDPDYAGGGIRESAGRTFLPPHIDFNHHPRRLFHRRLNLLLYLNKDWDAEWGGNLQVHKDPRANTDSLVASYTPLFNRCLIFETSEISWHGFDRLKPPPGKARRAFTIYFYTKDRPGAENIEFHSTEYVEPPLPRHLSPGYTLTAEDVALLQEAYARRDGRIEMLYALRRNFDGRFAHVWHEYEYYLNAWKKATGQE